jgi:hypothetical protein
MSQLLKFIRCTKTLVIPLAAITIAVIVLMATGHLLAAQAVSAFGTMLVLFLNVAYIVFWHSRRRWPGLDWKMRLERVISFKK